MSYIKKHNVISILIISIMIVSILLFINRGYVYGYEVKVLFNSNVDTRVAENLLEEFKGKNLTCEYAGNFFDCDVIVYTNSISISQKLKSLNNHPDVVRAGIHPKDFIDRTQEY